MSKEYNEIKKNNREKIKNYSIIDVGDGTVDFFPAYIQLEHTKKCNARCIMCNHFYLGNRGCEELGVDVVQALEQIFPYCENIMLNGDGEPFLCQNIESLLKIYHKYGIRIGTNTNLCAMKESFWKMISEGFDFLNISCDGCTQEIFERIRRGLNFKTFVKNAERLRREAPYLKMNLDCVLMIQNIMQIPEIVDFAADMGFNAVKFNLLGTNPIIGNQGDSVLNFTDAAAYYLKLAERRAFCRNIPIVYPDILKIQNDEKRTMQQIDLISSFSWSEIETRYKNAVKNNKTSVLSSDYLFREISEDELLADSIPAPIPCQWALERCYIDLKGNVTTCCYNMHYRMGNILEKGGFEGIWNGKAYRTLRKMMAERKLPHFCFECSFYRGRIKTNFLAGVTNSNENTDICTEV